MEGITIGTQLMISATLIKIDFQPQGACFQFLKEKGDLSRFYEKKNIWKNFEKKISRIFSHFFFLFFF